MKKTIAGLFTIAALTLHVQAYDQTQRIEDMQTMEKSMTEIQKGILYNDQERVVRGVESLQKTSGKVEIVQKDEMDYTAQFAKKQAENINRYADKLKRSIEANEKHAAAANYTKVLKECVSCHNKIRKWNR